MPNKINSIQIDIDADMEKLLIETVIEDFKAAEEARNKKDYGLNAQGVVFTFDEKIKHLKDMYYGRRQPKVVPWKNCSNRSMKIAMAIIEMLHARMFPAVWNEDLIRWKPGEKTDKDKVERINKLMDWWVKVKTHMQEFFDKWCKFALGFGDVLTEASWEINYKDVGEFIETPIVDEFGVQLYEKNGNPSISKEKKLKIEENTKVEIIPKENVYFQEGQTDIQKEPVIIKCHWLFADLEAMEVQGQAVNVTEPLFEKSSYLKDKVQGYINEIYAMNNSENLEIIKEVKLRATFIDVLKCYRKIDIDRDGIAEDVRILIDPLRRIYLGGVAIKDISKKTVRPLDFTKVNFYLEDPDALEGYGFLEMVMPLAEEIDAIFNQITDANTLSVLRPGFYDPVGNLQPQNITLAPNKLIPLSDPQRNVYFPNIEIPIERLLVAMRGVLEFIERLTGASSYVMGKESEIVGGSGTATRTQAIVGAAEQRFSIPAQRLRAGAARILTLILDQLQKNIPPGLETRILGEDDEPVFNAGELTSQGIDAEMDAYLLEDVAMGSQTVVRQLAQFIYTTMMANMIIAQDPVKVYKETALLLKAFGQDPLEHLGQEPDPKDTDNPQDENTLMVEGSFGSVRALLTENHIEHIFIHQQLSQSPTLAVLTPMMQQQVLAFAQAHIQEHTNLMQQMQQISAKIQMMKGQNGATGAVANNQGVTPAQGMGNIQEPFASVERTKEQGTSGFSPTM